MQQGRFGISSGPVVKPCELLRGKARANRQAQERQRTRPAREDGGEGELRVEGVHCDEKGVDQQPGMGRFGQEAGEENEP
jgi:hypothetical protein